MAKEEKVERGFFEELHLGRRFKHNNIDYTKVSGTFAEIVDNHLLSTAANAFFDGTTTVHAHETDFHRPKRKD